MAVVLHHAEDGDGQSQRLQHLHRHIGVIDAAVDEQQVRLVREFLVPFQVALEPPCQHLFHGGVIIRAVHILQLEMTVIPLQRTGIHIHHHRGHDVVGALVGDVVGLDAPGRLLQIQHLPQQLHQLALPLLPSGPALHFLHRVLVGQTDQVHLGPPLGGHQLHLAACVLG